ncbi:cytochrome P450 [Streptomyces sp. NBC_01317]|uniref:cytochrome P450 n=1 Tax=Streptomyces sp. NBC_01317 TaxID=2903822 RepID=UPI002E1560E0|nr:cytochrome P450 [Streptomyces sp. NBC_01317]
MTTPLTSDLTRLYGPEFAADAYGIYRRLRAEGKVVPVEFAPGVPAMLVTDFDTALEVLYGTGLWSKDPRPWQTSHMPADSPLLSMLGYQRSPMFTDGEEHARYRGAVSDSLGRFEPHVLRGMVRRSADRLIQGFAARGECDLVAEFAMGLPVLLFNEMFGVPDRESTRLATSIAAFTSAHQEQAKVAWDAYLGYIGELVDLRVREPGQDLTSWLLSHPARLTTQEVVEELLLFVGAAYEPTSGLIANSLHRMLTEDRYYSTLTDGALTVHDALRVVLWKQAPVANYGAHYPRQDTVLAGVPVPAHSLVLISFAAINDGLAPERPEEAGNGGRSHLAFSAGPHACPAKDPSVQIAVTAVERLTSWLPTLELAVPAAEIVWRPTGFLRALTRLPVRFTPIHPDQEGTTPWTSPASA